MRIGALGNFGATAYGIGFSPSEYSAGVGQTGALGAAEGETEGVASTGKVECQTCKQRKYMDGSDENVSFKSATHISPEAAAAAVRGHEAEHVSNAYDKAATGDGKVISASVSIHTAICPECGRTYVSGGTTSTTIRYNESTPYGKAQKTLDSLDLIGGKMDFSV